MNGRQKLARISLVSLSLFLCCVVAAGVASIGLCLAGHLHKLMGDPTAVTGLAIIVTGIVVNAFCFRTLHYLARHN